MPIKTARDEQITREMLHALECCCDLSQRNLAKKLGIALGATNTYINKFISTGLLQKINIKNNRVSYRITPLGKEEKNRLAEQQIKQEISCYYKVCSHINNALEDAALRNKKVLLTSTGAIAEITIINDMKRHNSLITSVYSPNKKPKNIFLGYKVKEVFGKTDKNEVYIFTTIEKPLETYKSLVNITGEENIIIPKFMKELLRK